MGIDGISANQLRITPDNNSRESSNIAFNIANQEADKSINALDKKGSIDTDDKENTSFSAKASGGEEEEEQKESVDENETQEPLDLTNKELYEIKVDENSNSLTIYNKEHQKVVQEINPKELSILVDNLKNPSGIIVNKRI